MFMAVIFKKVPFLGTLWLEKTLYCRAVPEIFIAIDEHQQRYLCIKLKTPGKYLVGRIEVRRLLQLLRDERPLYDTIRCASVKGIVTGLSGHFSFSADIPEDVWPVCDRLLGLYSFDVGVQEYHDRLKALK